MARGLCVSSLINPVSLGFSITQGALAFFAPCAVALLPGYLSALLSRQQTKKPVIRAIQLSSLTILGIVLMYGVFGLLLWGFTQTFKAVLPWLSIMMGGGLIVLGIAMFAGKNVSLSLHKQSKHRNDKVEAFLFGIAYAIAALGCLFPLFLVVITLAAGDGVAGLTYVAGYIAAMSAFMFIFYILTVFAQQWIQKQLYRILPYMNRIAGAVIILAGIYIICTKVA